MLGRGNKSLRDSFGSLAGRLKARAISRLAVIAAGIALSTFAVSQTDATPEVLALTLHHLHTDETATIVFKRNGVYDQDGLQKLNYFLRDWRQERPTNMDPHLFDLLWEVYKQSGSNAVIQVVCGYRAPVTNAMLRRRSNGVAENSLHMQGKAIDFFIPDVPLEKLREIGLRMQAGGVGFYPTSGSPFVHMDTGNVRHWPRMTHDQLVRVFPDGKTLDIPTDGQPLPGYAEALAEYNAKKATGEPIAMFADASFHPSSAGQAVHQPIAAPPIQVAAADTGAESAGAAEAPTPIIAASVAVAVLPPPLPHLAPRRATLLDAAAQLAAALDGKSIPVADPIATGEPTVIASLADPVNSPTLGGHSPDEWTAPTVPPALAVALASLSQRDTAPAGDASLPIAPTAVVATIDVNRPLRAEAITTAVMRTSSEPIPTVPLLAYADDSAQAAAPAPRLASAVMGVPLPSLRPRLDTTHTASIHANTELPEMPAPDLTLTSLDTKALRLWISPQSTRQKAYALLTMPDFASAAPALFEKPLVSYGAGFSQVAYADLRTDRFSGPLVEQPHMVDLRLEPLIASAR